MPGEHFVIKQRLVQRQVWHLFLVSAALAACGGSAGNSSAAPGPVTSPRGVVEQFLQAVADSNLRKMASLWGTAAGPAAKTNQPPDYERRIVVMQAYLKNEGATLTGDAPDGGPDRHVVQVELRRDLCTRTVPFTVIKLGDGTWLVNQVDLGAAGNPARPCIQGNEQDTTASH
jgi:hypothetical protein